MRTDTIVSVADWHGGTMSSRYGTSFVSSSGNIENRKHLLTKHNKSMVNIKRMQMGDTICADARVGIKKGFLGLSTKYTYLPTESPLEACELELSPEQGSRLLRILQSDKPAQHMEGLSLKAADNGSYLLEAVRSQDGQFAVLHLLHWTQLNYDPVTAVLFFEGDDAWKVSKIF